MTRQSRRRVLKGLAVTLPATWATPMVKSVLLPAHAQTSGICGIYAASLENPSYTGGSDNLRICADVCNGSAFQATYPGGTTLCTKRTGTVPIDGSEGALTAESFGGCGPDQQVVQATITDPTQDSLTYTLERPKGDLVVTLNRSESCPPSFPLPS